MKRSRSLKLVSFILTAVLLGGCVPHTELNEKAIVMAIGIDYEDELYSVTFQYYSPTGLGGRTLVDNSQPNVLTAKGRGENVYGALEDASFRCGKELMLGVTQIIIIGEEAAKNSVERVVNFTKSFFQSHPDMMITVAEGKAEDMMQVKFNEGIVSTDKLRFMLTNAEKSGIAELPSALSLFIALQTKQQSVCIPYLRLIDDGKSDASQDGKTLEIAGGVLIKGGKMVDMTDIETMSGLQLLCCKAQTATVTVDFNDEKISVGLMDVKTKIKPSEEDGKLILNVTVTSEGRYLIDPHSSYAENDNKEIEVLCGNQLVGRMETALENTVYKHGADPFLVERTVRHYDYGLWKTIEDNFEEYLKNAEFRIDVKINIDKLILTE